MHCREHLLERVLALDGLFYAKESAAHCATNSAPFGAACCLKSGGFCPAPAGNNSRSSATRFDESQKQMGYGKLGGSAGTQC